MTHHSAEAGLDMEWIIQAEVLEECLDFRVGLLKGLSSGLGQQLQHTGRKKRRRVLASKEHRGGVLSEFGSYRAVAT